MWDALRADFNLFAGSILSKPVFFPFDAKYIAKEAEMVVLPTPPAPKKMCKLVFLFIGF